MDPRQILEAKREEYRQKMRQNATKARRTRLQQSLMKNLIVYHSFSDDILRALHEKDESTLKTIIEDFSSQPLFFSGISNSGILSTFINIIKYNQENQEEDQEIKDSIFVLEHQEYVIITKILLVFSKTVYDTQERLLKLLNTIWPLLQSDIIQQVKLVLNILTNILKDQPQSHQMLTGLGLVKQLCEFLKQQIQITEQEFQSSIFQIPKAIQSDRSPLKHVLIDLVFNHLSLLEKKQKHCCKNMKEKQIVQCISSNEYDYFLKFAVSNILKNQYVIESIETIHLLIEYIPAYADCVTDRMISYLIKKLSTNHELCNSILLLLDSVGFYCSSGGLQILYECNILDALDKQLYLQQTLRDSKQEIRITNITFIICNMFCAKNDHMIRLIRKHPILDHIFGFMQPGHPLIKTARVFDYYFRSLRPGDKFRDVLDAFLQAASVIDQKSQEGIILSETIRQIYLKSLDSKDVQHQEYIENKLAKLGMECILDIQ